MFRKTSKLVSALHHNSGCTETMASRPKSGPGTGNCTPVELLTKTNRKYATARSFVLGRVKRRVEHNERVLDILEERDIKIKEALLRAM